MRSPILFAAVVLLACAPPEDPAVVAAHGAGLAKTSHPASSCGFCADIAGRNDVKHLCPASLLAWNDLVEAICVTSCAGECGSDWCSRLNDVWYVSASNACNACVVAECWPELAACSGAM